MVKEKPQMEDADSTAKMLDFPAEELSAARQKSTMDQAVALKAPEKDNCSEVIVNEPESQNEQGLPSSHGGDRRGVRHRVVCCRFSRPPVPAANPAILLRLKKNKNGPSPGGLHSKELSSQLSTPHSP